MEFVITISMLTFLLVLFCFLPHIIETVENLKHKHEYIIKGNITVDGTIDVIVGCAKCSKRFGTTNFTINESNWYYIGKVRRYQFRAEETTQKKTYQKAQPKPQTKGWWTVLGVSPNSSKAEINAAYHQLAKKYHPDMGGDAVKMAIINAARDEGLRAMAA